MPIHTRGPHLWPRVCQTSDFTVVTYLEKTHFSRFGHQSSGHGTA